MGIIKCIGAITYELINHQTKMRVAFVICLAFALAQGAVLQQRGFEPLTEEDFKLALKAKYGDGGDEDRSPDLFEGDIVLNDEDKAALEDRGLVGLRKVVGFHKRKWPQSNDGMVYVPYAVPAGLDQTTRNKIARIVLEYQAKTCIRMVPHKGERHHINFMREGMVCSSPLGMQLGKNNVDMGYSCSWGSLAHEVMHSLGFFHEHTRSDRDNYITINWNNVPGDFKHNFWPCTRYHEGCNDLSVGYDYDSIMHYKKRITGTPADQITPKQAGVEIGQRKRLSEKDVQALNEYYSCAPGSNDSSIHLDEDTSDCKPDTLSKESCERKLMLGWCKNFADECGTTCCGEF